MKNRILLRIAGQKYTLMADESVEYMNEVASFAQQVIVSCGGSASFASTRSRWRRSIWPTSVSRLSVRRSQRRKNAASSRQSSRRSAAAKRLKRTEKTANERKNS